MTTLRVSRSRWLLVSAASDDGGDDWILTVALAILTLQMIRSSITLVKFVSALQTTSTETKKKEPESKEGGKGVPDSTPGDYGSIERKPLVSSPATQSPTSSQSFTGKKLLVTFVWLLLGTFFAFLIMTKTKFRSLHIITTVVIGFELTFVWTSIKLRDGVQRSLQITIAVLTWTAYFVSHTHFVAASLLLLTFMVAPRITGARSVSPAVEESTAAVLSWHYRWALVRPYIWPDASLGHRIQALSTWFCVIASKAATIASPVCLGWATTALAHEQYSTAIRYSVAYCLISWLGTTLKEFQSLLYLRVAQAAFGQLASHAFGHLHALSLDWHLRKQLGQVLRSVDRGIAACDTLMKYVFLWLVPAIAECLVVCIIFATYFQYLELGVAVFYFVFCYVVWTILVTVWRKKYRKALTVSDNDWHDKITDSLINFETVKFFTAESYELKSFRQAVDRYQAGSVNVQGSLSFLNISQQVILKACLAVSLSLAVYAIRDRALCCNSVCETSLSECCRTTPLCQGGMEMGDFVTVLTYTLNLFAPLNFLGSVYNAIVMATIDLSNMTELLAENPDVVDAPDALVLPKESASDVVVEFDRVSFHYPSQPADRGLKGVSFQMKRGTTTAIVGSTGAGKTTISRLLFRFYDVLGGAVKVNGVDVRSVTQHSLRSAMGVVPQAASLFNDTIRHNILYGRRDATEEELVQAVTDAQLLPFIQSLDEGWETLVGDRGLKLSGGEKQRAAIARCLLKNPPFVLLDEATSALDTLTENSVQEALDRLGHERTVLVIAHRLGTIRNADNIVVLHEGQVAEQGTHDELLERPNSRYAEMWNMQLHSTSTSTSRVGLEDLIS